MLTLGDWMVSHVHADVVLTFDQNGFANGVSVDQTYGDRVSGSPDSNGHAYSIIPGAGLGLTPNVAVEFVTGGDNLNLWSGGYGDLSTVLYKASSTNSDHLEITFTADPGFEVGLFGFDLAAFGSNLPVDGMEIRDGFGNVLWSQGSTLIPGAAAHASFDFASGLFAPQLTLDLDYATAASLMGIDNIHFAQRAGAQVPEPASACLVAMVCGMLVLRRSKRYLA